MPADIVTALKALASIVFVAIVIGVALASIFWPLMRYEDAMQNEEGYRSLIKAWVVSDVVLTIFLCRRDFLSMFGRA
jgi:hypothetical protein